MRNLPLLFGLMLLITSFSIKQSGNDEDIRYRKNSIHLNLKANDNSMLIEWGTETEAPGDYYLIEKSFNAKDWYEVTTVLAFEEENAFYSEIDDSFEGEECYYRVICIHMDKSFTFSKPSSYKN